MTCCILDCSVALAWVLPGEDDADHLLGEVAVAGAVVPAIWPFEVANVLLMTERRGRIRLAERQQALTLLAELPIDVESQNAMRTWSNTLRLAELSRLTVYDASYLEAAVRLGLPLASCDEALCKAAVDHGVRLLG